VHTTINIILVLFSLINENFVNFTIFSDYAYNVLLYMGLNT